MNTTIDEENRATIGTRTYKGKEALSRFYVKYRQLDREKQRFPQDRSAFTAYLTKCEELSLVPEPIGIVSWKGNEQELNIDNYSMGNNYASALSQSIKKINPKRINLKGNRLTAKGASELFKGMNKNIFALDLSDNRIGVTALNYLIPNISHYEATIQSLNLENNRIGNKGVSLLAKALMENKSLVNLNLSRNEINDDGAEAIAAMLKINYGVQNLGLHWNLIKKQGGLALCSALKISETLRILDLSWNALGNSQDGEFGKAMGKVIKTNSRLTHLDLSNNHLTWIDVKPIAEKLEDNHALIGIHLAGNQAKVDSYGFVTQLSTPIVQKAPLFQRIEGRQHTIKDKKKLNRKLKQVQNCWICEGWTQYFFQWTQGVSGSESTNPVYIHFEFDDWLPHILEYPQEDSLPRQPTLSQRRSKKKVTNFKASTKSVRQGPKIWKTWRMIPPGTHKYFYTFDGNPTVAADQMKIQTRQTVVKVKRKQGQSLGIIPELEEAKDSEIDMNYDEYRLNGFNICQVGRGPLILNESYDSALDHCKPRVLGKPYVRQKTIRLRTPWNVKNSIFRSYRVDTEELLNKCFEFDWSTMKRPKIPAEQEEIMKEYLRQNYKMIREAFKFQAGQTMSGTIPSIPFNGYNDTVAKQMSLVDNRSVKFAESDTLFLTVNGNKKTPLNPANALVRFQFFQILIRLALKRYFDTGKVHSQTQAMERLIQAQMAVKFGNIDSQRFRDERYWCEQCQNLIKAHYSIYEELYKAYGGTHRKPGEPLYLTVDEFEKMINEAGLVSPHFVARDISLQFTLAMQTTVDEITQEKHLRANLLQFIQAIARVAEKVNLPPMDYEEDEQELTHEEIEALPLFEKLKSVTYVLLKNCTPNGFRQRFVSPEVDEDTGLYIINRVKF